MAIVYTLEICWTQATSILSLTAFQARPAGQKTTYDVVTSVSGVSIQGLNLHRGKSTPQDVFSAGDLSVTLLDQASTFDPQNTASPIYSLIPGRHPAYLKASVNGGAAIPLFFGFVDAIRGSETPNAKTITMSLKDNMLVLSKLTPVLTSLGATTTGAAITRLVNAAGTFDKSIQAGDSIPSFSTDGTKAIIQAIGDLLTTERGTFFAAKDGTATYVTRSGPNQTAHSTTQATFTNAAQNIQTSMDTSTVVNQTLITRTGGTQQSYTDSSSVANYGPATLTIASDYITTDQQSLSLATYLVQQLATPRLAVDSYSMVLSSDALASLALAREIGDHITINDYITGDFNVLGLTLSVNTVESDMTFVLARRGTTVNPFVIGVSLIGSATDKISY